MRSDMAVKKVIALFLAFILIPVPAPAQSIPVNPAAQPSPPAGDAQETVSVVLDDDYYPNIALDESIVAQLDAEAGVDPVGPCEPLIPADGIRNVLVVSTDTRPDEEQARADAIIVLTVDSDKKDIGVTSFLSNMYVSIPGCGNNYLNAAWEWGGIELLRATLLENFGLSVEDYVVADMMTMISFIDKLGSVVQTVKSEEQIDAINGVIAAYNVRLGEPVNDCFLTETGEQRLNGRQAAAFASYRKNESYLVRTGRQRKVLIRIFKAMKSLSLVKLSRYISDTLDCVETSLSLKDVISILLVMKKKSVMWQVCVPGSDEYQKKIVLDETVLLPDLNAAREHLQNYIYGEGE